MRNKIASLIIVLGAASGTFARADAPATPASGSTPCAASVLRFAISDDSPGMGHAGILMSLRNASATTCTLPAALTFAFENANGDAVATATSAGNVVLKPGTPAFAHATWSDGGGGNTPCADPTKFVVSFSNAPDGTAARFSHALPVHLCSDGGTALSFTPYAFSLTKDPVPVPAASAAAAPSSSP